MSFWEKYFIIDLLTPNPFSKRRLYLTITLTKNSFTKIRIWSWEHDKYQWLEKFFAKRFVFPEW